jgi:hypothetical protein
MPPPFVALIPGYLMEFGLYAWQPDGSVDRKLKEGAKTLVSPSQMVSFDEGALVTVPTQQWCGS